MPIITHSWRKHLSEFEYPEEYEVTQVLYLLVSAYAAIPTVITSMLEFAVHEGLPYSEVNEHLLAKASHNCHPSWREQPTGHTDPKLRQLLKDPVVLFHD